MGKVVDSILPSITAFEQRRNKTIVGSMKTTLRERWQEVVEELQRSNLPNIHLLTVDEDISTNKINQMAMHNIVLVVLKEIKDLPHCRDKRSVISFEEYFLQEIPTYLNYWKNNVYHAVFGKSRFSPLQERIRGSVLLDFLHDSVGIDVHVISTTL